MNNEKKEFDRSKCFTFFSTYRTQGQRIEEILGRDRALDYYKAIIDYGLYAKPIEDEELLLYIGDTLLETIDSSQKRRERSFGHEDMTATRSIIELVRDRPGLSQDKIAKTLNVSKGKVNKVLNKFKAGDYAKEFDFNIIINGTEYSPDGHNNINDNSNINYNNNSTDRDRDRCGSRRGGSYEPNVAADAAPCSAAATHIKINTEEIILDSPEFDEKNMKEIIQRDFQRKVHDIDPDETYDDIKEDMISEYMDPNGYYKCNPVSVESYISGLFESFNDRR